MVKKNICFIVALVSLFFALSFSGVCYAADTGFMDGSGTEEDPYLISSKKQLDNVRYHKDAHFKLVSDIKFTKADFAPTGEFYNDGHGWRGIGWTYASTSIHKTVETDENFTGTFDGNGHIIDGLYQHVTNDNVEGIDKLDCNGLFGSVSDAVIKNLNLTNVDISSDTNLKYAIGLAAVSETLYNTTIDNCSVSGNIEMINRSSQVACGASSFGVGDDKSVIKNCHNDANITVTSYCELYGNGASGIGSAEIINCYNTGDIKGICTKTNGQMKVSGIGIGSINQCYNVGKIYSSYDAGGICGGGEHIQNSYNRGYVYGGHKSGGIMGNQHTQNPTSCTEKCYNIGVVECGTTKVGAIVGGKDDHYDTYLRNCYFLENMDIGAGETYTTEIENLKKCTSDEMKCHDTFKGFDFDDVWIIDRYSGYEYPVLRDNRDISSKKVKSVSLVDDSTETVITSVNKEPTYPLANVKYDDGSEVVAELTKDNFKDLDISKTGIQICDFYYAGKDTGLTVKFDIKERIATSLSIISNPTKTEYVVGQPLSFSGGKIKVDYDNGTSDEMDIKDSMIDYDNTAIGSVVVTIKVDECTAKYNITVNEKTIDSISVKEPKKLVYYVGDELDITGGKVVVTYQSDDYYSEDIDMKSDMISDFDSTDSGIKIVKVTYGGFESSFSVNIKALVLNEIKVTKLPDKIEYTDTELFDNTGMVVTGYYNSGKEEAISDYEISGFGRCVDNNIITVKIGDKTDKFNITVHKPSDKWDIHESTCTEDGYKSLLCSGCGKELQREVIAKNGHNIIPHDAKTATCIGTGNNAYWSCDKCNKYFSDAACTIEITKDSWVIPAKGHKWDEGKVTNEPTETEKGIKIYTCSVCHKTKIEDIPDTGKNKESIEVPPTSVTPTPAVEQDKTIEVDGVGTISADGKTITDTDGEKYLVAEKITSDNLVKNIAIADMSSAGKYKITKLNKKKGKITGGTVTYIKPYNKNSTSALVKDTVKLGGVKFRVTIIANNAFKGSKIKKLTIGKYVIKIGKNAASGCSNLKSIKIKSKVLNKIGSKAFYRINTNAKFKVPNNKLSKYKKMIKKAKAPKKAKITK